MFFSFQFCDVVEPWNAFVVIILGILYSKHFEKKFRKKISFFSEQFFLIKKFVALVIFIFILFFQKGQSGDHFSHKKSNHPSI
jgi:hypothetical protein